ncbi:MAG: SDR family NAD(P)-dependent oxidoreductase, partial [Actinomycetaceae bacterium]|nr:SDR family NAD(P)-dependent oxidoreductase [Actinomycetaceae bacterium]
MLEGKVAIITGGAKGMGEATAKLFAENGAKVVIADIDVPGGERVTEEIKAAGGEAAFVRADISKG